MERTEKYSAPSVETAARILQFLKESNDSGTTFSQICRSVGIPKSTGFHILKTLQKVNFVEYDQETKLYSLGWALVELGASAADRLGYLPVVRSYLKAFVRDCGLTGLVMQRLHEDHTIIVEKIDAPSRLRVSASVGESQPIWWGSQGKVFLAFACEEEIDRLVTRENLRSYTLNSITDPARFKAELARVRKSGWAYTDEEYTPGVRGIAAPVFDHQGQVVLAISVVGFTSALPMERVQQLGLEAKEVAARISETLAGRRNSVGLG